MLEQKDGAGRDHKGWDSSLLIASRKILCSTQERSSSQCRRDITNKYHLLAPARLQPKVHLRMSRPQCSGSYFWLGAHRFPLCGCCFGMGRLFAFPLRHLQESMEKNTHTVPIHKQGRTQLGNWRSVYNVLPVSVDNRFSWACGPRIVNCTFQKYFVSTIENKFRMLQTGLYWTGQRVWSSSNKTKQKLHLTTNKSCSVLARS